MSAQRLSTCASIDEADVANAPFARKAASDFVRRHRIRARWFAAVGSLLFVGGFTGFAIVSARQDQLQKTGTHAMAKVVDSKNSLGGAHIDVRFRGPTGLPETARLAIAPRSYHYRPGQSVEIAYDPKHPSRAVFTHHYNDPGVAGLLLFWCFVLGLPILIFGAIRLWLWRRARKALQEPVRSLTATSRLMRKGSFQNWAIALSDETGQTIQFWAVASNGCSLLKQPTAVTVFGDPEPGSVIVVVEPELQVAFAGRVRSKWIEPIFAKGRSRENPAAQEPLTSTSSNPSLAIERPHR